MNDDADIGVVKKNIVPAVDNKTSRYNTQQMIGFGKQIHTLHELANITF